MANALAIVRHPLPRFEDLLAWSVTNCHAKGVHSLGLDEKGRRRIFITDPTHELWRNSPHTIDKMSVGMHPHHCAVRLTGLDSLVANVVVEAGGLRLRVHEFRFYRTQTPRPGGGYFRSTSREMLLPVGLQYLSPKKEAVLGAKTLHTIFVRQGFIGAWLVEELEEDTEYDPLCYSDQNLETFDWAGLYRPMSESQLRWCLQMLECPLSHRGPTVDPFPREVLA